MIRYKIGSVLNFTEDAIAHGCNCFKTMGAGVAVQIRKSYPEMYEADKNHIGAPQDRLGKFTKAYLKNGKVGYNIYSQFDFGGGGVNLNYKALRDGLEAVKADMIENNIETLALPKIGAGLAGGDWEQIEHTITEVFLDEKVKVCIYKL